MMAWGLFVARADLLLGWQRSGSAILLSVATSTGTNYQFQISTNLLQWHPLSLVVQGNNRVATQHVNSAGSSPAWFRVAANSVSASVAPEDGSLTAALVGQTLLDYTFISSTRFQWQTVQGNWDYSKNGNFTGRLVFTYDEDNNDPGIYREEVLLSFISTTFGSYAYSEFYSNLQNASSISTGVFELESF